MGEVRPKIGFVGVGVMGQCGHLRNYASIPDCEVVALAEIRPELGRKVAQRYGVPGVYASAAEMIEKEKLHGIVATQPFDLYGSIVPELYQAGVPILTEKPFASSVETGEKILSRLKDSNSWHMIGYQKRCDPATIAAKTEIDRLKQTGELGALQYIRITIPFGDWIAAGFDDVITTGETVADLPKDPPATDMDAATYEQYVWFITFYCHQANLLRHLLGESYKVNYVDPSGKVLVAESKSGIAATIEMSPYNASLAWQETAFIAFEYGFIKLELPSPLAYNRPGTVEFFRDRGDQIPPQTIIPQLPWVHALRQQAITFVQAIKGEAKAPCTAEEAFEDLKIARQFIKAWKGV